MKYSGIGGQAVLEGVMMKNKEKYAVAVRKPDGEITVDTKEYYGLIKNKTLRNIPILREYPLWLNQLRMCYHSYM